MINYEFGISLVLFLNKDINILKNNFIYNYLFDTNEVYFILYDENKTICNISENI